LETILEIVLENQEKIVVENTKTMLIEDKRGIEFKM
jgi:hypothetical protein